MATITKLKSGRWQGIIRRKGHPAQYQTFRTKALAEAWCKQAEGAMELGLVRQAVSTVNPPVADLLARYKTEITPRKKGKEKEESRLALLTRAFDGCSLAQLTTERVVAFADSRLRKVGSDTVRRDLAVLSSVLETAKTLWGIPFATNPAQEASKVLTRTRTFKRKVHRVRRVSHAELDALTQELNKDMVALVRFALETALRRGELAKLTWRDIQDDRLTIRDDKTGKTTTIPLSATAVGILDGIRPARVDKDKDKDTSVFNREADSITQAFNRACARAGIEDLRVHDLRHEATSRLFEKGLSIEQVAMITRHSDWRSLKIYTHPSLDHIKTLLD